MTIKAVTPSGEVSFVKESLLLSLDQIRKRSLEPLPWIVRGHFLANSLAMIFGPHKQYKTFVALDLALSIASGDEFLETLPVERQGIVVYVAGEGGHGVAHRVEAWLKHRGHSGDGLLFYQSRTAVAINDPASVSLLRDEIMTLQQAHGQPVVAIVIDTMARNFGDGDENKTSDMNKFVRHCDQYLKDAFGALVCVVHHVGHSESDRGRGNTALPAAADTAIKVSGTVDAIRYEPKFQKDAATPDAFVLEGVVVDLFKDDDGHSVSSLVLQMTDREVTDDHDTTPDVQILLDVLARHDGPVSSATLRDDFFHAARKVPIAKGKNRGKERDNTALRQAYGRAVKKAVLCSSVVAERDNDGKIKTLSTTRDTGSAA